MLLRSRVRAASLLALAAGVALGGELQSCQGNPATRVVVDPGKPLGDRQLLDGGRLPPGDPTIER
jgi:hypothetical protein